MPPFERTADKTMFSVQCSPDGKHVACVVGGDAIVRVWDVATGKLCASIPADKYVVAFGYALVVVTPGVTFRVPTSSSSIGKTWMRRSRTCRRLASASRSAAKTRFETVENRGTPRAHRG